MPKGKSSGEQTGKRPASLSGLSGQKLTPAQQKTVYASNLTQAPNKKKGR